MAWFKANAKLTDGLIARIPGREMLAKEWTDLDKLEPGADSDFVYEAGHMFYKKPARWREHRQAVLSPGLNQRGHAAVRSFDVQARCRHHDRGPRPIVGWQLRRARAHRERGRILRAPDPGRRQGHAPTGVVLSVVRREQLDQGQQVVPVRRGQHDGSQGARHRAEPPHSVARGRHALHERPRHLQQHREPGARHHAEGISERDHRRDGARDTGVVEGNRYPAADAVALVARCS